MTCAYCGGSWERRTGRGIRDTRTRYCTGECRQAAKAIARQFITPRLKKTICPVCKQPFERWVGKRGRPRRYCDWECTLAAADRCRADRRFAARTNKNSG
jgi:hypothetical protein